MKKEVSKKIVHPFGKMVKGISSFLLKEDELSDSENMTPGFQWKQRKGQSELTTSAVASGLKFKSLFHFAKLDGTTDVVLAHVYDSVNGDRIMYSSALPPNTCTWTALFTLTSGCSTCQFSQMENQVLIANNKEFLIWRGTSHKPTAVYKYLNTGTAYINCFDEMTDGKSGTTMSLNSMGTSDAIYICSDQPLNTITFTVSSANSNSSTMTVKRWTGSAWSSVTITDGTAVSGATLGQTGSVTWTAATDEFKHIIQGLQGYWYQVTVGSALDSSVSVSAITVHSPMARVRDIWNSDYSPIVGAKLYDGTNYGDCIDRVCARIESLHIPLDAATTSYKLYLGFVEPVNNIFLQLVPDQINSVAATLTVKYFKNDGSWTAVSDQSDGTSVSSKTLAQSGTVSWKAPGTVVDGVYTSDEKPYKFSGDLVPLYWYEFTWSATLSATVSLYFAQAVRVCEDPEYSFGVASWKGRAWQVAPLNAENGLRYSAYMLPNTWNGSDSGYIYLGDRPLKRALRFYNELLVFADRELWLVQGSTPDNFGKLLLSGQIGTCAPMSVVMVETGVQVGDTYKVVVVWLTYDGFYMFDGVKWFKISSPDVDCYFNPDYSECINPSYLSSTYGGYDYENQCVFWLVYSGASQTTPNKVIVLNFPTMRFGVYDYETEISSVAPVANGRYYLVGGGNASGKFYLLNSTNTDVNSSGVAQTVTAYITTRDIWNEFDEGLHQRHLSTVMDAQSGGLVQIDEYPDGSETPLKVTRQKMVAFGRDFVEIPIALKDWPNQLTTKYRFLNQSQGKRMNPYGLAVRIDESRSEES